MPVEAGDAESPAHDPQEWEASDAGHLPGMWLQDVQNGKEQIECKREVIDGRETAQRVKER